MSTSGKRAFILLILNRSGGSDPWSPWNSSTAWRLNQAAVHSGAIVLNGQEYNVPVVETGSGGQRRFRITAGGKTVVATGELDGNELYADIDGYRERVVVVPHDGMIRILFPGG